jgi:hypothetical protein
MKIRTTKKPLLNIESVPREFKFPDYSPYPVDNKEDFEWWLANNLRDTDIPEGLTYLPITWTAYYKQANYAADKIRMHQLQKFLNGLNPAKRYFTIVQWDDGILHQLPRNTFVFAMGSKGDYQLPLICQPHQWNFPNAPRDIPVSFIGRITHPIREKIIDKYAKEKDWYISTKNHSLPEFCRILARSKYVLCPRGYGVTSFRIAEALQYGAAPVYISNVHLKPHGLNLSIHATDEDDLTQLPMNNFDASSNITLYRRYFTYEANKQFIIEQLKKMIAVIK